MDCEFGFDALGVRLGNVEDDTRRAASGVQRDLQVLDVIVESCSVEGDTVPRIFEAGFIIPQRLVPVGLEAAEGREIRPRAQRDVERVIDAAEAEALGRLNVDAQASVRLPAEDPARREAFRTGLVRT